MDTSPTSSTAFDWSRLRAWVPLLGVLAVLAVAMKLPNMFRLVFGQYLCPVCNEPAPFVTALAGAYFVFLTVLAVCFPRFPGRGWAYLGLLWALFLAAFLIGNPAGRQFIAPKDWQAFDWLQWKDWQRLCPPCTVAHGLHILMWLLWWVLPLPPKDVAPKDFFNVRVRLCIAAVAWLSGLAAFGTLHRMMLMLNFPAEQSTSTIQLPTAQYPISQPIWGGKHPPATMPVKTMK